MSNGSSPSFVACVLALLLALAVPQAQSLWAHSPGRAGAEPCGSPLPGVRVSRTELFLGLSMPGGSTVSDAAFQRFVDAEVSPRLPDGFTIVAGQGQFRAASGAIAREPARVLVVLHPSGDRRTSSDIERIRAAYKEAFRQESVLRVDGESCALT
jgi:hypothetical protein